MTVILENVYMVVHLDIKSLIASCLVCMDTMERIVPMTVETVSTIKHVTMSTAPAQMDALRDSKGIFAKQNAVLMNTDETVRNNAVISVTTMKLVIPSLDIVADALTVIEMKNAMKNVIVVPMERTVRTSVGNVLML